jgi:hypothetical protein
MTSGTRPGWFRQYCETSRRADAKLLRWYNAANPEDVPASFGRSTSDTAPDQVAAGVGVELASQVQEAQDAAPPSEHSLPPVVMYEHPDESTTQVVVPHPAAGQLPPAVVRRPAWLITTITSRAAALVAGLILGTVLYSLNSRTAPEPTFVFGGALPVPLSFQGDQESLQIGSDGVFRTQETAFRVRVRSPHDGFTTILLLSAGETDVWPQAGQPDIAVTADTPVTLGPYGPATAHTVVLLIVTAAPRSSEIADAVRPISRLENLEPVVDAVRIALKDEPWIFCSSFVISTAQRRDSSAGS